MADTDYRDKIIALTKDAEDRGLAIVPVFSFDFGKLVDIARDVLYIREDKIVDFINAKYMEFAEMIERLEPGDIVLCDGGLEVSYEMNDVCKVWKIRKAE